MKFTGPSAVAVACRVELEVVRRQAQLAGAGQRRRQRARGGRAAVAVVPQPAREQVRALAVELVRAVADRELDLEGDRLGLLRRWPPCPSSGTRRGACRWTRRSAGC